MRRAGISPSRTNKLDPAQIDQAIQLYKAGDSLATIGRHFNVDAQTVRNRLAEAGVQIRKRRGWSSRRFDPTPGT